MECNRCELESICELTKEIRKLSDRKCFRKAFESSSVVFHTIRGVIAGKCKFYRADEPE